MKMSPAGKKLEEMDLDELDEFEDEEDEMMMAEFKVLIYWLVIYWNNIM